MSDVSQVRSLTLQLFIAVLYVNNWAGKSKGARSLGFPVRQAEGESEIMKIQTVLQEEELASKCKYFLSGSRC